MIANLLRAESIKLASTRAPWFCLAIAIIAPLGFTALVFALAGAEIPPTVGNTQIATGNGRTVLLVLAVLATASEFNWGTMRLTFQAVPSRVPALLAKVVVVGAVGTVLGLVLGFGSWGLASLVQPDAGLALRSAADWRSVLGQSLVFLFTAVAGVGVALLLRSVAFALTVVIVWTQVLEGIFVFIPGFGKYVYQWMPFHAADEFVGAGGFAAGPLGLSSAPIGPWGYLGYFAAITVALFLAGVLVTARRDA
ncbi:ABC transporter permease [Amycolatopsis rifamycinica]|uniref:Membrane protein n=1 Tax=Amycolatopsis rifamycinica TaxID=287986 RepID=A0A066U0U3_9PSEU|nr:ABC transporter permease [Amycolatopsis rifamycinica]KDN17858.1 membrane protein [Amycolatopsis rifamycinica]